MSPTRHMASIRAASPRDVKNFCTGGGCGGLIRNSHMLTTFFPQIESLGLTLHTLHTLHLTTITTSHHLTTSPHHHGGGGCGGLIQSFLDPHAKNLLEHEFGINPPHPPPHHTTTPPHLTTIYLLLLLNQ